MKHNKLWTILGIVLAVALICIATGLLGGNLLNIIRTHLGM